MFTGIITGVGRILGVAALGADATHGSRLEVQAPAAYLDDVALGDSIAINGACMTAVVLDVAQGRFEVDVSAESLARTAGLDAPGAVNLEKALRATDRLGGHLVSGHIDGVGEVVRFEPTGESWLLQLRASSTLGPYLAYKGSVAVNGVSLTVNAVDDIADACLFSINLIPHTVQNTTLRALEVGSRVNLEVDLVARYVARMLAARPD